MNRRQFLKNSVLATASLSLAPTLARAQAAGANGDIRVAVVGLNSRGKNHLDNFAKQKGVRVVAICDVDSAVLDKQSAYANKEYSLNLQTYQDYRKLLENKDIDAVSLATPNHWHSLGGIWAVQAGKDVYVEKPISHNIWEGRQLVEAARKYNRIVQTGTQSRSSRGIHDGIQWL